MIERCTSIEQLGWIELRRALWPRCTESEHRAEMAAACSGANRLIAFIAHDDDGRPIGFIEASLRSDYVNGTHSSPVGFIEGVYVSPRARLRGVARALIETAEAWAVAMGCVEMASDSRIENESAHAMHRALGFVETGRVVYFRKELTARKRAPVGVNIGPRQGS
jgi:aminoglycoside 6'-N-acetyltransferase I